MKKIIVAVEKTFVKEYEIWAENAEDATQIALEKNEKEPINSEKAQFRQVAIISPHDELTEWETV